MPNIAERYTGASVKRSEDPRILTGTGHYVDDVRLPGMLHAAFVRSTVAHARVTRVDVSEARRAPGVVLVLTGEELESMVVSGPGIAAMFAGTAPPDGAAVLFLIDDAIELPPQPLTLRVGLASQARGVAGTTCSSRSQP